MERPSQQLLQHHAGLLRDGDADGRDAGLRKRGLRDAQVDALRLLDLLPADPDSKAGQAPDRLPEGRQPSPS